MPSQAGERRGGLFSEGYLTFQLAAIWHMKSGSLLATTYNHEFAQWPGLWADPISPLASSQVVVFIFSSHQEHISVKGKPLFLWLYVSFLVLSELLWTQSSKQAFLEPRKTARMRQCCFSWTVPGIFQQTFTKRFPWHFQWCITSWHLTRCTIKPSTGEGRGIHDKESRKN